MVRVLLSSYNGSKYIGEQLDSILAQDYKDIEILVRDDGSSDNTRDILEEYSCGSKIKWYFGENIGPARSFWEMVHRCEPADYYAFCDQDDIWDPDKISIAVRLLEKERQDQPLLYFSDVRVVDSELNIISDKMVEKMPVDYPHSLIKNIAPGCTYVFNHNAMKLLRLYNAEEVGIDWHDWTVYRAVACFGKVVFDDSCHMSYRQHEGNAVGATKSGIRSLLSAANRFLDGKMTNSREKSCQRLLKVYGSMMNKDNYSVTDQFARYRSDSEIKRSLLHNRLLAFPGIKYFYFKLLVILNKM